METYLMILVLENVLEREELKWTKDKEFDDDVLGLTSERWRRLYMSRKEGELGLPVMKIECKYQFDDLKNKERLVTPIRTGTDHLKKENIND